MQAAPANQILVSDKVHGVVRELFEWDELPTIRVKGKTEPVKVYRVSGSREHRSIRLTEAKYRLPVVGREPELARLNQLIRQARGGQGQVIALVGEAGIGKSRLVAEVIRLTGGDWAGYGGE